MDINTMRGIATILAFAAFLGVCWWAYGSRRKARFDEAANLPFADEPLNERALTKQSGSGEHFLREKAK